MGLLTRIKYWDIWYDQRSLLLLVSALVAILVIGGASLYVLVSHGSASIPLAQTPTDNSTPPKPIAYPNQSLPSPVPSSPPPLTPPAPAENETPEPVAAESLEQCQLRLSTDRYNFDLAKAAEEDASDRLDRLKQDVQSANSKLELERSRRETMITQNVSSREVQRADDRIQNLQDDVDSANTDFTDGEDSLKQAQDLTDQVRKSLSATRDACRNLDLYLATGFRLPDFLSRDGTIKPTIADCAAAIIQVQSTVKDMKSQKSRTQSTLDSEQRKLNTLEDDLSKAQQRLDDLQNSTDDTARRAQENVVESFSERINRQQRTIRYAEDDVADAEQSVSEAQDIEREIKDICKSQGVLPQTIINEAAAIEKITSCTDALPAADALVQRAEDDLRESEKDRNDAQRDLNSVNARLQRQDATLANLTNSNATAEDINRAENRRDTLTQDVDDHEQEFQDAEDRVKDARENLSAAKLAQKHVGDRCGRIMNP